MGHRTLYTCDKCHAEHDAGKTGDFPIQYDWSLTQRLGLDVFTLGKACTIALKEFLGMPELPGIPRNEAQGSPDVS